MSPVVALPNALALIGHCDSYGWNHMDGQALTLLRDAGFNSEDAARIFLRFRRQKMGDRLYNTQLLIDAIKRLNKDRVAQ